MAARFWIGGTGNWTDTAHWSTTSGGGGGSSAPVAGDAVTFDGNSGATATVTVDTAPQAATSVTINKVDLTLILSFGLTLTGAMTLTTGTLNTNGKACSFGSLLCAGVVSRTLTLGASAITITTGGGSNLTTNTVTNLTWTANTATITFTAANASWFTTIFNVNGTSMVFSGGGGSSISGASGTVTMGGLTITGTAVKTDIFTISCNQLTCTNLTINGQSVTNRIFVVSNVAGTARALACTTVVSLTNADFQDVTASGPTPFTGTSLGDCQGNTGITFTTPATQTFVGTASGSFSDITKWTSRVPLPQDDVVISSAFVAGRTVTIDMPRPCRNLDFTGTTGSPTVAITGVVATLFGNLTLAAGVAWSNTFTLAGRGVQTFTSAGVAFAGSVTFAGVGGSYAFQDNTTIRSGSNAIGILVTLGTLVGNGKNITTSAVQVNAGAAISLGSGTWTVNGTGTIVVWSATSTSTVTASTSTIDITATDSAVTKTFAGGDRTYNIVKHTAAGGAALTITGTNTFATLDLECSTARTVTLPAGVSQTVTGVTTLLGASGQTLTLVSSTPGTRASLLSSHWPGVINAFLTPSTDVRLVHRQLNAIAAYQNPALV